MDSYTKILALMRDEGMKNNEKGVRLATVTTSSGKVKVGELVLSPEDYLIEENLKGKLKKGDKILIKRVSEDKFAVFSRMVKADA